MEDTSNGPVAETWGDSVGESVDNGDKKQERRGRSTIVFPYDHLDSAVNVARVVHTELGGRCQADQLAAKLNQRPLSGDFG